MVLASIACPVVASLVSTVCTSACTSIFCCTDCVVSFAVMCVVSVTRTPTSENFPSVKPAAWILTLKFPPAEEER